MYCDLFCSSYRKSYLFRSSPSYSGTLVTREENEISLVSRSRTLMCDVPFQIVYVFDSQKQKHATPLSLLSDGQKCMWIKYPKKVHVSHGYFPRKIVPLDAFKNNHHILSLSSGQICIYLPWDFTLKITPFFSFLLGHPDI